MTALAERMEEGGRGGTSRERAAEREPPRTAEEYVRGRGRKNRGGIQKGEVRKNLGGRQNEGEKEKIRKRNKRN